MLMRIREGKFIKVVLLFTVLCMISAFTFIGCAPDDPDVPDDPDDPAVPVEPGFDNVLRLSHDHGVTLDPHMTTLTASHARFHQMFNSLFTLYPDDRTIRGDLVKDYEETIPGREFILEIHQGVQFHQNYGELTTEDVVFSMERIMDEDVGSPHRGSFGNVEEIEIIDDYTLRIKFTESSPYYKVTPLSIINFYVISKAAYEEKGEDGFAAHPIGSGPYEFVSWDRDELLVQEAFDDYFGGRPHVDRIEWIVIPESAVAEMALQQGDIDALWGIPDHQQFARLAAQADGWGINIQIPDPPPPGTTGFTFDLREPPADEGPWHDLRARQAVAYAIDNELFVNAYMSGLGSPAETMWHGAYDGLTLELPPGFPTYAQDLDKAKALFDELGIDHIGKINAPAGNYRHESVAMTLRDGLEQIDIGVELEFMEHTTHNSIRGDGLFSLFTYGAGPAPILYPRYMAFIHSTGGPNRGFYGDVEAGVTKWGADDLIEQIPLTLDDAARAELYELVRLKTAEELPHYPVVHHATATALCNSVQNWRYPTYGAYFPLHEVVLDRSLKK